jgi:hypothetical protein
MEMSAFAAPLLAILPFESGPFPNHYGQKHRRDPEGQRLSNLLQAQQRSSKGLRMPQGRGEWEISKRNFPKPNEHRKTLMTRMLRMETKTSFQGWHESCFRNGTRS